jgi:hypothetical protein
LRWNNPISGNYSPVIPAKAGIHDTVGLFIVKQSFPPVIPAKAGIHPAGDQCELTKWIPAFAGMTGE